MGGTRSAAAKMAEGECQIAVEAVEDDITLEQAIKNPQSLRQRAFELCRNLVRLWEAAVKEASSLKQDDVIKALDHAKISQGPGGPAEMVPGQHHLRMNMYIAQAKSGRFEIVKNLGVMDPKECMQGMM